jgi:hypothetical protein
MTAENPRSSKMSANPKIENLFVKDIRRKINGVIKVDQDDDDSVYTELDEYVVTQESLKHFGEFFDRYYTAAQTPTDDIGVWVSGFFGSGKSHFIKILSYLLENKMVHDRTSLDFFREKIPDPLLFDTIEKAVNYGTRDVILFNIDSKGWWGKCDFRLFPVKVKDFIYFQLLIL